MATFLIYKKININHQNSKNLTALHLACINNVLPIVRVLILYGGLITIKDDLNFLPIHYAIKNDNLDILNLFESLSEFTFFNHKFFLSDITNFDLAITNESWKIIKNYIGKELVLKTFNQKGNLPLHTAAIHGSLNMFLLLISKGADIEALNKEGKTALSLAKQNGHKHILEYLKTNFNESNL